MVKLTVGNRKQTPRDWVGNRDEFTPGWWIKDPALPDVLYLGPYDTKKEADEQKSRMTKWHKKNKE